MVVGIGIWRISHVDVVQDDHDLDESHHLAADPRADLDGDRMVTPSDWAAVVAAWMAGCSS